MKIPFYKYQGTGNDFVLIDNRKENYLYRSSEKEVRHLCDRKFGIGADGLILLNDHSDYDFEMVYFNADGRESSMCGNGGRCIVAFAKYLNIISEKCTFLAIDGRHDALINAAGKVALKMKDVNQIEIGDGYYILDTGSPHYVVFVEDLDDINIVSNGQAIRYSERFKKEGINVNFVEADTGQLLVGTYERGVEEETLSCGTGVTASAIAYQLQKENYGTSLTSISTKGGNLEVELQLLPSGIAKEIWLKGPAVQVFKGEIQLS